MEKLKQFLKNIEKGIDSQHSQSDKFMAVNKENAQHFIKMFKVVTQVDFKGKKILDVGFGVGDSLRIFKEEGASPVGICLNQEEIEAAKDCEVYKMDQNFMTFEDNTFDVVWSRHCLEHSVMPYYTLFEYKRVAKKGAFLYVEVPAPETVFHHEDNPEHFSVFPMSVWLVLMNRLFEVVSCVASNMVGHGGNKDVFYSFVLRK